tara:strand:+ start:137 stop:934 length:798 start_codon:yes stop_codon:yes gene_type:complete
MSNLLTTNPFIELSLSIPAIVMQIYIIMMILFVAGGTVFDVIHKRSAKYFFDNWKNARNNGRRIVKSREAASLAIKTVAVEILMSGEFCNIRRRIAHLLSFYGFIIYVCTTFIMVFFYLSPGHQTPVILPALWTIGGIMTMIGGYWFWFFIRVDVSAEGHSPFRIVRADLFILSLLISVTMGMLWAYFQAQNYMLFANFLLILYIVSTTVLFGSVPISKFSHMFFKPAAAFQKRIEIANESRSNLPAPAKKPLVFGKPEGRPRHF